MLLQFREFRGGARRSKVPLVARDQLPGGYFEVDYISQQQRATAGMCVSSVAVTFSSYYYASPHQLLIAIIVLVFPQSVIAFRLSSMLIGRCVPDYILYLLATGDLEFLGLLRIIAP